MLCVAVGLATTLGASAQIPTAEEVRQLAQESPDLVRQQLLQSGLSEQQIRLRIRAAGLPADIFDGYYPSDPTDAAIGFDGDAINALEALGISAETADGLELVPVTAGMQPGADRQQILVNGLPIFGLDVFTRASSQFQPLLSGPVPDDYLVGPGDQLVLMVTGEIELARELVVSREGFLLVRDVGRISVANLTMADLRILLRARLANSYSGITRGTVFVDVTITQLRTIQIYVTGEVAQAGAYQLASVATVTNALYAAGGLTVMGSLREIKVQKRSGVEVSLDLYPYLLNGDVSGDVILEQGDVVFVPVKGRRVQLRGSVVRPGLLRTGRR